MSEAESQAVVDALHGAMVEAERAAHAARERWLCAQVQHDAHAYAEDT